MATMKFSTPAEPFKRCGEMMVFIQITQQHLDDLKSTVDYLESCTDVTQLRQLQLPVRRPEFQAQIHHYLAAEASFKSVIPGAFLRAHIIPMVTRQGQEFDAVDARVDVVMASILKRIEAQKQEEQQPQEEEETTK